MCVSVFVEFGRQLGLIASQHISYRSAANAHTVNSNQKKNTEEQKKGKIEIDSSGFFCSSGLRFFGSHKTGRMMFYECVRKRISQLFRTVFQL